MAGAGVPLPGEVPVPAGVVVPDEGVEGAAGVCGCGRNEDADEVLPPHPVNENRSGRMRAGNQGLR